MRTTLDIPDAVFKKAKLKAVEEGVALKVIVARALEREIEACDEGLAVRKKRVQRLFAALDNARNTTPVGRLDREQLYDRALLRRH